MLSLDAIFLAVPLILLVIMVFGMARSRAPEPKMRLFEEMIAANGGEPDQGHAMRKAARA